jgi:hypothetical protein
VLIENGKELLKIVQVVQLTVTMPKMVTFFIMLLSLKEKKMPSRTKKREKRERRREQLKELRLILPKILQLKIMNNNQPMKNHQQEERMKVVSLILKCKRFIVNM